MFDWLHMQVCLSCGIEFTAIGWQCPNCAWAPSSAEDFLVFAAGSSQRNDGFDAQAHEVLARLQGGSFWFRSRNRLIEDLAKQYFPQANSILEVGCGTGYVLGQLARSYPGKSLQGSEIHLNALAYAKANVPSVKALYQMDARAIPFSQEFDLLCAFDVLEHIEEDEAVLLQFARAITPGGGILLSVPQHPQLWSKADDFACHKRRYRIGELERKCLAAGFAPIRSTSFVTSLLPVMAAQRLVRLRNEDFLPSREMMLPKWLNKCFEMALDAERRIIRAGVDLPFGGSRFVVAIKTA